MLPSEVLGAFRLPCFLGSFEFNSHCCISVPWMCVILGVDMFFSMNGGPQGTRVCLTVAHRCSLLSPENVSTKLTEAGCHSWQDQLTVQLVSCR